MRDPKRIDRILNLVGKIWEKYPDLRLSQLIVNIVEQIKKDVVCPEVFYFEDDDLEKTLEKLLK